MTFNIESNTSNATAGHCEFELLFQWEWEGNGERERLGAGQRKRDTKDCPETSELPVLGPAIHIAMTGLLI
jgi:hypothetical protein